MARPYYTLLVRDGSPGCQWSPEFGDYDQDTVKAELDDWRDQGFKRSELKIIKTAAKQADIMAKVAELNN